jgi:hypothetical protein
METTMTINTQKLIKLAELAATLNGNDWGSEAQIDAENTWVEAAYKELTPEQIEKWDTYALKALTEEAINYGLKLLGINHTVSEGAVGAKS